MKTAVVFMIVAMLAWLFLLVSNDDLLRAASAAIAAVCTAKVYTTLWRMR